MAANTTLPFSLQAKDWETVVSIIFGTPHPDLQKMIVDLINYYSVNSNPQGSTLVPITVKEKSLVKIFEHFYGNTVSRLYNDVGGSAFKRVIDAIRLANNTADNYISTQLAALDAKRDLEQTAIRKSGRSYLMMENFDNN
jgi:hypothetical protein